LLIPDQEFESGSRQPATTRTPPTPPEPSSEQISRLTNVQLQKLLKMAAGSLSTGLDRVNTGDRWKKYLEMEMLQREFSDETRGQV